jgi:hypothetical protein
MGEITPDGPIKMTMTKQGKEMLEQHQGEALVQEALAAYNDANVGNILPEFNADDPELLSELLDVRRMVRNVTTMLEDIQEALDDLIVEM